MNIKKLAIVLSSALALGALSTVATDALATGSDTADLAVSANINENCTISAGTVAFGAYDPVNANLTAALPGTGTVTVTCTIGTAATITLGEGLHAEATSAPEAPLRQMADTGANRLKYSLVSATAEGPVWGNTAGTGVSHTGDGTATALTVFGSVAGAQNMPPGSYSDTVVATVSF